MKIKVLKYLMITGVALAVLQGCGSQKSELKKYLKCGMAASQLGMPAAKEKINQKLEAYIKKNNIEGSAREAMFLVQEIRDDFSLHNKSVNGQINTLIKAYNSSTCRKIHEQAEIKNYQ